MMVEVRKEEMDKWEVCSKTTVKQPISPHIVTCKEKMAATWIRISIPTGEKLYLNEVEVYGKPIDEG